MGIQERVSSQRTQKNVSILWVPLSDLVVASEDSPVNRRVRNAGLVAWIAEHYDERLLGVLVVTEQNSRGKRTIIDGQHRALGLRERGWKDQVVPCTVIKDATDLSAQAMVFLGLQRRVAVKPVDILRNEIQAKELPALEIDGVLRRAGFTLGHTTNSTTISAAASLKRIQKRGGGSLLERVLATAVDAWGKTPASVNGEVLDGLAMVLNRYPEIDAANLAKKLRSTEGGADGLRGMARSSKTIHGSTISQNIAACAVVAYNTGKREGRLPDWWAR